MATQRRPHADRVALRLRRADQSRAWSETHGLGRRFCCPVCGRYFSAGIGRLPHNLCSIACQGRWKGSSCSPISAG